MLFETGSVRTWLYTSQLTETHSLDDIAQMVAEFQGKNKALGLTGFMLSDGRAVMQLLEGGPDHVEAMKDKIIADPRHRQINSEVWALEQKRAYPNWSMNAINPSDYEKMFKKIELANVETIATNIARLLFDVTFEN